MKLVKNPVNPGTNGWAPYVDRQAVQLIPLFGFGPLILPSFVPGLGPRSGGDPDLAGPASPRLIEAADLSGFEACQI